MRKINRIIIHCSATPEKVTFSVSDIDRWHKEKGYSKIGYHYVVLLDGQIAETARKLEEVGAHCKGENGDSIGICYVGGLDKSNKPKDTRTEKQKVSLRDLVSKLRKQYPEITVHGHNEYSSKSCPCFNVKEEFNV